MAGAFLSDICLHLLLLFLLFAFALAAALTHSERGSGPQASVIAMRFYWKKGRGSEEEKEMVGFLQRGGRWLTR